MMHLKIPQVLRYSFLGVPCVLYGLAALALIRHTETIEDEQTKKTVPVHFLIKEDHN